MATVKSNLLEIAPEAMIEIVKENDVDKLKAALQNSSCPRSLANSCDKSGKTLVMIAAENDYVDCLLHLILAADGKELGPLTFQRDR